MWALLFFQQMIATRRYERVGKSSEIGLLDSSGGKLDNFYHENLVVEIHTTGWPFSSVTWVYSTLGQEIILLALYRVLVIEKNGQPVQYSILRTIIKLAITTLKKPSITWFFHVLCCPSAHQSHLMLHVAERADTVWHHSAPSSASPDFITQQLSSQRTWTMFAVWSLKVGGQVVQLTVAKVRWN